MDVSMDPLENNNFTDDNNSEEQQNRSKGAESSVRPSLSKVKKSWGFRRTTIARREFLDEVGDLAHSPPPVRRGRGRRTNQTPQVTQEPPQRGTQATRSVIEELEWSAPSSPVSEESKSASEASAGGMLDPSLWQDFGSAFHTAFSLLGGNEGLSLEMSDALVVPSVAEDTDATEAPPPQASDEPEVLDNMESVDDMEILQPIAPANVAVEEMDDVVLISSQEEDSDEMTLIQIKEQLASKGRQGDTRGRGGKSGRGKARERSRGRGRGRGKGRGRGRGRGRAVDLQSSIADIEDNDDEVGFVDLAEEQLQQFQEEEKVNDLQHIPAEIEISPAHSISRSTAQQLNSDCIIIDTDVDQIADVAPGQYDDAPEEEEKKDDINVGGHSGMSDPKSYDSDALYCICRQRHNNRFMICCDSCQEWFHGNCVGISKAKGLEMEREGQEYICPPCTTKKQSQLQPDPQPEPEPQLSFPECLTLSHSREEGVGHEEQQAHKETAVVVEEAPVMGPEPEPEAEMETDSSLPLCIGPGCSKQALPDSVYCGTDCILQHAAVTMKTLSVPKVPKSRGRTQRKAVTASPSVKGQRAGRMSLRLAAKAEEEGEEEEAKEDHGEQKEAASPLACDPSLIDVQPASLPSSKLNSASDTNNKQVEADVEDVTPSKLSTEDTSTDGAPPSQPAAEAVPSPAAETVPPQSQSQEKTREPISSGVSKQQSAESSALIAPNPAKSSQSPGTQSPSTSAPRHHETGALMVTKTSYIIPKKKSERQPLSSHVSASTSCQKPSSTPTLLNETRNLPVPPAPSAPSSRPSQPNNQVRQSIQRSLTSILFKRVCDCEDLEMSESEVAKLVASIEMEMFDIFRNTDSKYMNKYRTIMFNLKDPRNKGLLYRVLHGEISPFRLARMSQKDMQATKASEPSAKETTEVKDAAGRVTNLLQKPEAVKVELPSFNPARPDRSLEQKKNLSVPAPVPAPSSSPGPAPAPAPGPAPAPTATPTPTPKTKTSQTSQPSQITAVPDILTCMLKDTTSEHKAHLFDLKCKICTGQILAGDAEEPTKKKPKVSETRDKYESSWRKSAGDESPLRAPPESPDMDSPTSILMDPSSCLTIDSPVLTIVESPASPIMDSPASPTLESPASPIMDSPASPTPDTHKATITKKAYTPVVIPAVSTVTITRRDPRTAASRFSALSSGTSGPSNTTNNQSVPYAPLKEKKLALPSAPAPSLPPTKTLPKSILMKPSSCPDTRLYGSSSRTVISGSLADGETAQFLAKQDILWKGFLNMLTVAKFVSKGYLVSGSPENLKADLPDTIQIGGRIMPQTVWEYVAKLKTSVTKELCVIRFQPATEEEEVAYVSLFSYFSSRGRFGVVANSSRSIKDLYLVPLSAKESIPSILQPLEGPGLEKKRPNLLLGLAIVQKAKRPGSFPQEIDEKRPKVHMSKDPMWIPKPPVLYGSDKLEIFQPYDPETPANTTPPGSPSCPRSPSESSSGSVTMPSLLTSVRANTPVSTSANVAAALSISNSISEKNPSMASSDETPLQTILKSLFGNKQTDAIVSSEGNSTTTDSDKKLPVFSQVSGSMVDPIVQQYGLKSKVKEIEEENDFDRPYDPEEEYDPAMGYEMVASQSIDKIKADGPAVSGFVEDDVAYDPEDETIFADIQNDVVAKPPVQTQMSDFLSCPTPDSTQSITSAPIATPVQTSSPVGATQNLPTGTVVVSAATLTEQQRMLEELNKQIEEQKRQLKEQEEALRQQREAVGMFMAHFSVSDSLMSPPTKSLPLNQLSQQSDIIQTESQPSELKGKTSNFTESVDSSNVDLQTVRPENTTAIPNFKNDTDTVTEQEETQENINDNENSSAGEIEDSDVAYDPEDESLFNEIQEEVFQGGSIKTQDSSLSRTGHSACRKSTLNSYHGRKRRLSPKRRSHRERDRHRSPSRKSQRRSPSHSQRRRERDRQRRGERDRSRHRTRDQSERQSRHRKEHTVRRHSHSRRRSSSSPRKKHSVSLSPKQLGGPSPPLIEKSSAPVTIKNDPDGDQLKCNLAKSPDKDFSPFSHELLQNLKHEVSEPPTSLELQKNAVSDQDDTARDTSIQVDKPSQQETLLNNKIESTVPLREIDPPIRDSPQSPDPEPQFVKPSNIEKNDCVKIEEITDFETYTGVTKPLIKVENRCQSIGGDITISNILWPSVGGPDSNVRNFNFRALDLQHSGVRDQGIIEADKQIEREIPGLKHPEILDQQGGHLNPATGSDLQASGSEIDSVTRHSGLCMSGTRNPGPDMKDLGHRGPQLYLRETGITFPGPNIRGSDMQGIKPRIWIPGPDAQDPPIGSQGKCVRDPLMQHSGTNMSKAGVQHQNTDRFDLGPVMGVSRISSPMEKMKGSSMQGVNQEVKCPCPDVRQSNLEMTEKMVLPAATNLHIGISGRNERRDTVIQLDRPGPDMRGSESREPLPAMYLTNHDTNRPVIIDERRSQDISCLRKSLLCVKTEEHKSQPETPNGRPSAMDKGKDQSFRGPHIEGSALCITGRVRGESPHTGSDIRSRGVSDPIPDESCPVVEERGHREKSFHSYGRDGEMVGRERNLELKKSTGFEGTAQRADRLSPSMTDERRDPQRGRNIPMPGPNINYKSGGSNMVCTRQNSSGPREHFKEPQPDIRADRNVCGPDIGESGIMHELGRIDVTDRSYMGHGQDIGSMDGSDFKGNRNESHGRNSGRNIAKMGPNRRDSDLQARNIQGIWLERRNEHMGQGERGPIPNNTNPDWRGPGPSVKDDWREPDRRGSGPVRVGPLVQDEWTVHQPDREGPHMGDLGHDRRRPGGPKFIAVGGPGGQDFMGPGPERRGSELEVPMHGKRGPVGPDFRRPEPQSRGPTNDNPGPGIRGPGGPDFVAPGLEMGGLPMEGPGPNRSGQAGKDFRGPWNERRGPDKAGSGPDGRGLDNPNIWGPGPERRGTAMDSSGTDRRRPGGQNFWGPGPEGRGLSMEGPGPNRMGPGGPDFRGPGPERESSSMGHPGPDNSGPGGPDFSGPGHERKGPAMEDPGTDRRGPGGPDFWGPGPESRGLSMEGPWPERRGPGGPDFRGPGPELRGTTMEALGPDRRRQGGSDFSEPGPDRRGPAMGGLGPYRRESGGPDFSGPGHERRGPTMDSQDRRGPECSDFHGQGPEIRGLVMDGPECDKRIQGGLDLRELECERRGLHRGGPYIRGPGPDFIGPWSHQTGPYVEGPGPHTGGQGGPLVRDSGPESGHPNMEGPGSDRRGPGGPNMRRLGVQHLGPNTEGLVPDRRGSGGPNFRPPNPEKRPLDMERTSNRGGFPGGPQFGRPEPERRTPGMDDPESGSRGPYLRGGRAERPVIEGPGPNRKGQRGPDFRGPGCESKGPDNECSWPDKQKQGGSGFRGPGPERKGPDMECNENDWRRSSGPDFRGPGSRQTGSNTYGPRQRREDWGRADFRESEPIQEWPDAESPGPDRTGRNLRGPQKMRRNFRALGRDINMQNRGDPWKGPDFRGSGSDRRDTDIEEQWSDGRGPIMEDVGDESVYSGDDWKIQGNMGPGSLQEGLGEQVHEHGRQGPPIEWRGPGSRGTEPRQERPNMLIPGPLKGPGDEWSGSHCRGPGHVQDDPNLVCRGVGRGEPGNDWREPNREGDGPNRWGPGSSFRGERGLDRKGQGHDKRGPGIRGPGSGMMGDPEMGNNLRQPEFRGNNRNIEGPGAQRGGPDSINSLPNRRRFEMEDLDWRGPRGPESRHPGTEYRNSNIECPGTDGRFLDGGGLEFERRGVDIESTERDKGFDDFRIENRGPDMRRLRPDKTDLRGQARENMRYSSLYSRPLGPAQNSGGNSCPGFDDLKNQQAVKPQRHRGALLPTPTEGLIRFPNRMVNNPDVFSPKRKQIGHAMGREWIRGRPVSRERELAKRQRQEHEKSLAVKISSPVNASTVGGEEKKLEGKGTDKHGIHDACVETKTD